MAICAVGAFSGFLFVATLDLQALRGLTPLTAGLVTAPMAATLLVAAPLSGRLVGTAGRACPWCARAAVCSPAPRCCSPFRRPRRDGYIMLASWCSRRASGCQLPDHHAAVSGMPRSQAGVAAAFASTSRQIGASLGVAVIGSLVNTGGRTAWRRGRRARTRGGGDRRGAVGPLSPSSASLTSTKLARRTAERTAAALGDATVEHVSDQRRWQREHSAEPA